MSNSLDAVTRLELIKRFRKIQRKTSGIRAGVEQTIYVFDAIERPNVFDLLCIVPIKNNKITYTYKIVKLPKTLTSLTAEDEALIVNTFTDPEKPTKMIKITAKILGSRIQDVYSVEEYEPEIKVTKNSDVRLLLIIDDIEIPMMIGELERTRKGTSFWVNLEKEGRYYISDITLRGAIATDVFEDGDIIAFIGVINETGVLPTIMGISWYKVASGKEVSEILKQQEEQQEEMTEEVEEEETEKQQEQEEWEKEFSG